MLIDLLKTSRKKIIFNWKKIEINAETVAIGHKKKFKTRN